MSLTVLSIAYPFAPVGPHAVGGAEQILGVLDRALVAEGRQSLVVACKGSRPEGRLFAAPVPEGLLDGANTSRFNQRFQAAIDRALDSEDVDMVHMHGLDFHHYRLPERIPVLVTLHMPIAWYPLDTWASFGPNVHFQCVSEYQKIGCPPQLKDAHVIPNGVDLPPFDLASRPDTSDYAIALGRICPEKNLHAALAAGTLAGTRVLLGGQVFPYRTHLDYLHQEIEPALNCSPIRHESLGTLLPDRKTSLLSGAKCLLHPTLAPETSSLVAMEALAVGTPVIAFRSGALPEIVEDGVTGFLVSSVEEMADAIRKVNTIDPAACREAAERRFSSRRMIEGYFGFYRQLTLTSHTTSETCAYA